MAFQFVAAAHYDNASMGNPLAAGAVVIAKPTGTINNDLMFLLTKHNTDAAITAGVAGWTELSSRVWQGAGSYQCFYKVAGASEGDNYTLEWAADARVGVTIATFRDGFDTADPIDASSTFNYDVTPDTSASADGISVAAANSPLIHLSFALVSSSTTFTPPTSPVTFDGDHIDTWNTDSRFARQVASVIWSGSGATGVVASTMSQSVSGAKGLLVALNPSVGGFSGLTMTWTL